MIFLSNSPAFGFLFALIIQESFQLLSGKDLAFDHQLGSNLTDLIVLLDSALRSSSTHVRIEVSTFLQNKAKFWCIALRKPWLYLDLKERKGGKEMTFLCSVCWFFIIPIYDKFFLETFIFLSFIHSFVILLVGLYIQLHSIPQNLKPISSAYHQDPGREYTKCVSVEKLAFLYLIWSSIK